MDVSTFGIYTKKVGDIGTGCTYANCIYYIIGLIFDFQTMCKMDNFFITKSGILQVNQKYEKWDLLN